AFFTRSSAANIPVNLQLCQRLGLHEETYSVSIPLGATINMAGAAITITVLTMAAVHTLGIAVDLPTALLLSVLASISACGASGLQPVRYRPRRGDAGRRHRLHPRHRPGLGGNRAQLLHRCPVHCSCLHGGRTASGLMPAYRRLARTSLLSF